MSYQGFGAQQPSDEQMACLQQGGHLWVDGQCLTVAEFVAKTCAQAGGSYNLSTSQCEFPSGQPPAAPPVEEQACLPLVRKSFLKGAAIMAGAVLAYHLVSKNLMVGGRFR